MTTVPETVIAVIWNERSPSSGMREARLGCSRATFTCDAAGLYESAPRKWQSSRGHSSSQAEKSRSSLARETSALVRSATMQIMRLSGTEVGARFLLLAIAGTIRACRQAQPRNLSSQEAPSEPAAALPTYAKLAPSPDLAPPVGVGRCRPSHTRSPTRTKIFTGT
jgi:hypothetical protein